MIADDPNVKMVEGLIQYLEGITDEFVLIGGCATGLLLTNSNLGQVRPTTDVDLVTCLATRYEYEQMAQRLRERGFMEDAESGVICRWKVGPYIIDVIPTETNVFGFGNAWHKEAYETSVDVTLPSGKSMKLITSPFFLATKIEAFHDRGNNDFLASHDIEDIVTVLNGRESTAQEVQESSEQLQAYLRDEFEAFLLNQTFLDSLAGHLRPDRTSQGRLTLVLNQIRTIAQF